MGEYENVGMWKCENGAVGTRQKERQTADKCVKCESVKIGNQQLLYAAPLLRCGLCVKQYNVNMEIWKCNSLIPET